MTREEIQKDFVGKMIAVLVLFLVAVLTNNMFLGLMALAGSMITLVQLIYNRKDIKGKDEHGRK